MLIEQIYLQQGAQLSELWYHTWSIRGNTQDEDHGLQCFGADCFASHQPLLIATGGGAFLKLNMDADVAYIFKMHTYSINAIGFSERRVGAMGIGTDTDFVLRTEMFNYGQDYTSYTDASSDAWWSGTGFGLSVISTPITSWAGGLSAVYTGAQYIQSVRNMNTAETAMNTHQENIFSDIYALQVGVYE